MKVLKCIEFSKEVEVEISGSDAASAMMEGCEDWTPGQLVRRASNNYLVAMRGFQPRRLPQSVRAREH